MARSPVRRAGERLAEAAVRQSRAPALYRDMGAPDTIEGRFELMTLHVVLLIDRLKGTSAHGEAVRQGLFDAYVSQLDGAIREMGVGDLAVGKRMRKLGEAFYGRARAYDAAFAGLPDEADLAGALERMVLGEGAHAAAKALSAYVVRCRQRLAATPEAALLAGEATWPAT